MHRPHHAIPTDSITPRYETAVLGTAVNTTVRVLDFDFDALRAVLDRPGVAHPEVRAVKIILDVTRRPSADERDQVSRWLSRCEDHDRRQDPHFPYELREYRLGRVTWGVVLSRADVNALVPRRGADGQALGEEMSETLYQAVHRAEEKERVANVVLEGSFLLVLASWGMCESFGSDGLAERVLFWISFMIAVASSLHLGVTYIKASRLARGEQR